MSICIPVYNCAEFLGQALDSILPQTDHEIEVIVYDGGSTDGTAELMSGYLSTWINLQYHRGASRGGIDVDMAKCASFANGDYIWLFSGDDVMRPGALNRARRWIDRHGDDVYVCEHTICDRNMNIVMQYPLFTPNEALRANLSDPVSRLEWFKRARSTEPFFSFMSSLIVRREKWATGRLIDEFSGSCWGHVARLFELIPDGLRACYVGEVWLDQRGENDSFADKGLVNRFRIGIEGYHKLADTFFGSDSEEAFHIRRVIRNEFSLLSFMHAKWLCMRNPQRESKALLGRLVRATYQDKSTRERVNQLIYIIVPGIIFEGTRFVYRRLLTLVGISGGR